MVSLLFCQKKALFYINRATVTRKRSDSEILDTNAERLKKNCK